MQNALVVVVIIISNECINYFKFFRLLFVQSQLAPVNKLKYIMYHMMMGQFHGHATKLIFKSNESVLKHTRRVAHDAFASLDASFAVWHHLAWPFDAIVSVQRIGYISIYQQTQSCYYPWIPCQWLHILSQMVESNGVCIWKQCAD